MNSKYHECEAINKSEVVSIEKIKGSWTWIFWNDKRGNQGHGIEYCPYCGKKLEETESEVCNETN